MRPAALLHGIAMAAPIRLAESKSIELVFEQDLETGGVATTAWDDSGSRIMALSCSNTVQLGNQTVTFHAKKDASGYFTIGDDTFPIEEDDSTGVLCSRMYVLECFADTKDPDRFRWQPIGADSHEPMNGDDRDENDTLDQRRSLGRRQGCQTGIAQIQWPGVSRNPRKWRRHQQLTPSLDCRSAATCTTSVISSRTITHSASVGAAKFISAGYSVGISQTSGFSLSCTANRNQRVCVKHWPRYQQYDVRRQAVLCGRTLTDERYNIRAPLKDQQRHSTHYCATGTNNCRSDGWLHWEDMGAGVHGGA
ncbi:hypothetical protein FPSE_02886 [Fusarium pseudograminearum CS3096]|uniref:Uncharacterized protein n=1 Tax=Fusarium pseudograminearum (strain CS3096) TaxID=1028729 RepID=K3UWG9_FUSPC|nr:hypothetical protein FPSE_02886 [Fusarium pseudograminearum CS3096]EKJ77011.1 hypothetical protein FPSE_02886 [Fusarium pseudograminearum CS3096]